MSKLLENGGVSIFIVIFTTLMVTITTVSFTQIMMKTQQQATTNDLSQSAYDAAMAGVEDAKRVLVRLRDCENTAGCDASAIRTKLESKKCESLDGLGVEFNNGEVQVGAEGLNQAYTCVIVDLETESYEDETPPQVPVVIPLQSRGSFDRIRISWFSRDDFRKIKQTNPDITETSPTFPTYPELPPASDWGIVTPALMRAQLIQFTKDNIVLSQFNDPGTTNARTLFLYPQLSPSGLSSTSFAGNDARRSPPEMRNSPVPVNCSSAFSYDGYACQVTITLPDPNGGTAANREAYLQLQTFYQNLSTYKVQMLNGDGPVSAANFDTVQPRVDSTGRTSNLFRRVQANVSLRNKGVPYQFPDAALTVEGNLCKSYFITDDPAEYQASVEGQSTCDPAN